ncbi:MAG: NusG domain II-containing protein [Lachnospiraceae bacterium]|nr:NusG domain II-containing protein [Lachnospiraceae bacterium]
MKKFGVNDIKVLLMIAGLCLVLLGVYFFYPRKQAGLVSVSVDGQLIGTYDLMVDQTIPIVVNGKETNVLEIAQGQAFMKEADCPDHLCMKQGEISYQGETIVCLPNRVVVQVDTEQESQFDSIAK